jgi:hypothetical protein
MASVVVTRPKVPQAYEAVTAKLPVMMLKEPVPILQQIPDDEDVQPEYYEQGNRMALPGRVVRFEVQQLIKFDRNEKRGFSDGHPTCPTHAEKQTDPLRQRKQAIYQRAGRRPEKVGLGELSNPLSEIGPEPALGVEREMV